MPGNYSLTSKDGCAFGSSWRCSAITESGCQDIASRAPLPPCAPTPLHSVLQNALSPGQIFLTIHLLDTFGFTVDAIAKHIPDSTQRGDKGFMIGPIKVVSDKN